MTDDILKLSGQMVSIPMDKTPHALSLSDLEAKLAALRVEIDREILDESSAILDDLCYDEGELLDLIGATKISLAKSQEVAS